MQKKMSKKRLAFILVAVCLVGLIGIGISYSYYLASISTSNEENKNSNISSATITKVVMDMQGKVSSDGAYPGHKMVKEVVVRGIGESNSIPANASIKITPDLGDFGYGVYWELYKSEEAITCNTVEHTDGGKYYEEATCNIPSSASLEMSGAGEVVSKSIVVNPNTETKYYLVVEYFNSDDYDQSDQMGKSFSIDIGLSEKVTCPGVNNDGSIQLAYLENEDAYICSAPDAYGTSYYYRGNVTNNYVKFADKYWRIVRVNGDGSVRIIYDGTSAHANGEKSDDRQIGLSAFNENYGDNAYVGYMYGKKDKLIEEASPSDTWSWLDGAYVAKEYIFDESTKKFSLKNPIKLSTADLTTDYIGYYAVLNDYLWYNQWDIYKIFSVKPSEDAAEIETGRVYYGTSSKELAQTNANDSTIKSYLDNWYKSNILGTKNEQYLVDNMFCNDRSIYEGGGYGKTNTIYGLLHPYLKCLQQNDAFTVSDTTYGNGALTYPIGLITYDEAMLAGDFGYDKSYVYYLYSGSKYWTLTPSHGVPVSMVIPSNDENIGGCGTNSNLGVRPVINIKPETLKLGDGTMENPYRLSDD